MTLRGLIHEARLMMFIAKHGVFAGFYQAKAEHFNDRVALSKAQAHERLCDIAILRALEGEP